MSITHANEDLLYDYVDGDRTFCLTDLGTFYVRKAGQCTTLPWYENRKTGKPMIPARRRSFVSLVKMGIRDGDYD